MCLSWKSKHKKQWESISLFLLFHNLPFLFRFFFGLFVKLYLRLCVFALEMKVTKFHSLLQTCETCCCPWNQAKKLKGKEKEQEHGEEEMAYPLTIFKCGKAIFEFWINLFIQLDLVIGLARIGCFCPWGPIWSIFCSFLNFDCFLTTFHVFHNLPNIHLNS